MEFNEVRQGLKEIPFETLRMDRDNYFEAVIVKNEMTRLNEALNRFFGSPVFPSLSKLSFKAQELINGFGGIMPRQTLYFWNEGSDTVFAMLWPWQDGEHTTVKVIKKF